MKHKPDKRGRPITHIAGKTLKEPLYQCLRCGVFTAARDRCDGLKGRLFRDHVNALLGFAPVMKEKPE